MLRASMSAKCKVVMVAAVSVAGLVFSPGAAFADDNPGDWGFRSDVTVLPGSRVEYHPELVCDPTSSGASSASCTYSKDLHFEISALNGAGFTESVGSSLDLLNDNTGENVGTCTVVDSTEIDCVPDVSGSVGVSDYLVTGDAVDVDVPQSDCDTDVVALQWDYQGTDEGDDLSALYTSDC